jgi:hypothetical protein
MRDAIALFERELTRLNANTMMPIPSGFMGMMGQDPESIYDLLLLTPENTDSESDSEGSCDPLRECNILHLSEDGAAPSEDTKDDAYPVPRSPGEQAEYDQDHLEQARAREADQANECCDDGCPSPQHLNIEGA